MWAQTSYESQVQCLLLVCILSTLPRRSVPLEVSVVLILEDIYVQFSLCLCLSLCIVMYCLTIGICCEKGVVRQLHCSVTIIECTFIHLNGIAYYTSRLYGIAC